jgi:hypothetical protein
MRLRRLAASDQIFACRPAGGAHTPPRLFIFGHATWWLSLFRSRPVCHGATREGSANSTTPWRIKNGKNGISGAWQLQTRVLAAARTASKYCGGGGGRGPPPPPPHPRLPRGFERLCRSKPCGMRNDDVGPGIAQHWVPTHRSCAKPGERFPQTVRCLISRLPPLLAIKLL